MADDWQSPNFGDPSDIQLRQFALTEAVKVCGIRGEAFRETVQTAKAFYKFLKESNGSTLPSP